MSKYACFRYVFAWFVVSGATLLATAELRADGFVVDKVYHPYVNPIEREVEFRSLYVFDDDELVDGTELYQLGFAHAFAERFRGEFYFIAEDMPGDSLSLAAYELELKWQLSEQGEYFVDWGLLFEYELERESDIEEFRTAVLLEKELGAWNATLNLSAIYEWGSDIKNEWESELAAQLRYRLSPGFEPALEVYSGDAFKGLGPVGVGQVRFGQGRKLRWELGLIFGVGNESPDQVLRAMLEYEF